METHSSSQVILDVYISAHCWQCPEARMLAQEAQNEFATLAVRVIDLDRPNAATPAVVIAVPTFVVDGNVVSLGTPTRETLYRKIRQALASGAVANEQRKNRLPSLE